MCTVVEKFTNDGIQQGIEQGIKQGIEQGEKQIILNMHNKGCDIKTISDLSGISLDIVKKIIE